MNLDELEELAATALTSPIKSVRVAAEEQLRFLSSFDNWLAVKTMLPNCRTNYMRFILCKAIRFIVCNELGPQERREVHTTVLEYLRDMRLTGVTLPLFVRNELYSICAVTIYIDWKLSEVSMEQGADEFIGDRIVKDLNKFLEPSEVLDCVLEILAYFVQQHAKASMIHIRDSFVKMALPSFFRLGTCEMTRFSQQALELSCAVLEAVPRLTARVPETTDATVFLASGAGWFPHLSLAVCYCSDALLRDPQMELAGLCARFLRVASAIVCTDHIWFDSRNALTELFLELSEKFLQQHQQTGFAPTLQLACALLVNIFERDEGRVTSYLYNRPALIATWVVAVRYVLDQWVDGEEDLRQGLMHLFFLFADRVIPRTTANSGRGAVGEGSASASHSAAAAAARCSGLRAEELTNEVLKVFEAYFDNVVSKAHLVEDAQELRTDMGVVLHNEKTLLPLAEMLLCTKVNFHEMIVRRLMATIEQYELVVRARKSGDCDGLREMMLYLAVGMEALCSVLGAENVPLVLMHICLSRLSVVISIVAISLLNNTVRRGDELMRIIARFARELLSDDDVLTNALLECLSLFDDASVSLTENASKTDNEYTRTENNAGSSGSGYNNNTNNNTNGGGVGSSGEVAHVHVGIIRSLFFFCGCVCESDAERYDDFYEILLSLLRFVYLHHSDCTILVMDANHALSKVLVHGVRSSFLASDRMLEVLCAVRDERIGLLCAGSTELRDDTIRARDGFLTSLTFFVESRYYAGYGTADVLQCLIPRSLEHERLFADPMPLLRDVCAIADGVHQLETLYWLLDGFAASRPALLELIATLTPCAPLVLKLCSKICVLAAQLLAEDHMCEVRWELVSLAMHVVHNFMCTLSTPDAYAGPATVCHQASDEKPFSFLPNAVDESVVYNISDILCALFQGNLCSLGVLFYYEKTLVTRVLCGSVGLFLSTPVELLMSRESHRGSIFHAFHFSFSSTGLLGEALFAAFTAQQLWQPVLRHMVKCIHYVFLPEALVAIEALLVSLRQFDAIHLFVSVEAIGDLFHELVVLIAVSPSMESLSIEGIFHIITMCFELCQDMCEERLDQLLQFCSAYHRVRIRLIGNMLRAGKGDISAYYVSLFGTSSKVQTLSAW